MQIVTLLSISLSIVSLLAVAGVGSAEEGAAAVRWIREIRIVRGNVFERAEVERYAVFQLANSLHVTTREHIVSRELLFTEGDLVDFDLLDASERALRAYEFINEARVVAVPVDEATVDIEIYTHDSWTIIPGLFFETGGGVSEIGATVNEINLGGFGKEVLLEGIHTSDVGTSFAASYNDPQVFGSRWIANSNFRTGPLKDSTGLSLLHPFYSPDTRWAYGGYGNWRDETIRLFDSGSEVSRIRESESGAQMFISRAFGRRFNKLTAELQYNYKDQRFRAIEGTGTTLPDDAFSLTTSLGLFRRGESFVKDKHIRKMTLTEDIQLGFNIGARLGRAGFPIPEGEKYWTVEGIYRHAFSLGKRQYLFFASRVSTQDKPSTELSVNGEYYYKWLPWQTLALNVEVKRAWNLDSSKQFTLGGDSGLRGFTARRFNGDKSLLVNAESRLFSPIEILTVAVGAVVFIDAGRAWNRGSNIDLEELKYSAGFGLRLGFTRAPNEPMTRIDIGWPPNHGGFAVTVGSEHQF